MRRAGVLITSAMLLLVAAGLMPQRADSFQKKQAVKKAPDPFLNGPPFTLDQVLRLVRENLIPLRRQKDAIQNRGLDFSLSPEDLAKLKAANVSDELLALIHERAKPSDPQLEVKKEVRPAQGRLTITCAPAECDIAVAGASRGSTSGGALQIPDLAPGTASVDFSKSGYVGSQATVTIEADKVARLTATLEPTVATKEAFGAALFQSMMQALGGDAAVRTALSVQAEGSLTTWSPDGRSTRWNVFMRNKADRGLLQLTGGGSVFHEVAYVGNRFTTSKSLKGDDARDLPTDFGLLREYQLPALMARLTSPNFKMTSNAAGKNAGQDLVLIVEGGAVTISIGLNNELRPSQVKFSSATGLGSGIVTYSDYVQKGTAYYPQSMQIKPDSTPHGVDVQFDSVELDTKLKDSDYELRKKPLPSLPK